MERVVPSGELSVLLLQEAQDQAAYFSVYSCPRRALKTEEANRPVLEEGRGGKDQMGPHHPPAEQIIWQGIIF